MKSSNRFALLATVVVALSSLSSVAMAASVSGTANANVLAPMTITAGTALNFGTFTPNATGGTVVIATGGGRSFTGTVLGTAATTISAATFNVTGTGSAGFAISVPGTFNVTRTGFTETMAVVVNVASATGTLSGGTASFPVGGTLTVGAGQVAGAYSGSYSMTVEYN